MEKSETKACDKTGITSPLLATSCVGTPPVPHETVIKRRFDSLPHVLQLCYRARKLVEAQ